MPSAAILVGGRARRFGGRDKSALTIDGRTILERQIETLGTLTTDILLVGRAMAVNAPANVRCIDDRVPTSGPLGGLEAALAAAHHDPLVLLACDMPFVTAALLEYLLELAPLADVVVPRTDRGYHPLCAVYTRACREAVVRRLAERRLAIRDLFADVRVHTVEQDDLGRFGPVDRLLKNLNTPAEFDELETAIGHKP
jgi:molybdenum cofactor guanylyltransferase